MMANFIIDFAGALGTNFIFFVLVLGSWGLARVRPLVYAKPLVVYAPFGLGVLWYIIMFIFNFAEPPKNTAGLSEHFYKLSLRPYYYQVCLQLIVFLIIGIVGFILIKRRIKKTKDNWDDK